MRFYGVVTTLMAASSTSVFAAGDSCRTTAGPHKAAELVRQCKAISEETHPPCNALNPCQMLIDDIKYWCGLSRQHRLKNTSFCGKYQ
jgi:hypothetical protein